MAGDTKHPMRVARQKAGKTLAEVAAALDVSTRSVMRWELGQCMPPADRVMALAKILHRRPEDLVRVA